MGYLASMQRYVMKHHGDNDTVNDGKRRHFPLLAVFALLLVPASAYGWNAAQASASDSAAPTSDGTNAHVQKLLRVDSSTSSSSDQASQQHTSLSVNSSSTSVSHSDNVVNNSATSETNNGGAQTTVTINGQTVSLPPSGLLHKDFSDGNGSTSVDVSVNGNGSDTGSTNSSSINLQITNDSVSASGEAATP